MKKFLIVLLLIFTPNIVSANSLLSANSPLRDCIFICKNQVFMRINAAFEMPLDHQLRIVPSFGNYYDLSSQYRGVVTGYTISGNFRLSGMLFRSFQCTVSLVSNTWDEATGGDLFGSLSAVPFLKSFSMSETPLPSLTND